MSVIGTFRVGEDIALVLEAVSGDASLVTAVSAKLRAIRGNGVPPVFEPGAPPTSMTVAYTAASGGALAYWTLTLAGASTASLTPGIYGMDAKFALSGAIEITEESALIRLTEAAVT